MLTLLKAHIHTHMHTLFFFRSKKVWQSAQSQTCFVFQENRQCLNLLCLHHCHYPDSYLGGLCVCVCVCVCVMLQRGEKGFLPCYHVMNVAYGVFCRVGWMGYGRRLECEVASVCDLGLHGELYKKSWPKCNLCNGRIKIQHSIYIFMFSKSPLL